MREKYTFHKRRDKAERIYITYNMFVPVYASISGSNAIFRFLVKRATPLSVLMFTIRKKTKMDASSGLFLMIEKEDSDGKVSAIMANTNDDMNYIHNKYVNKDGFIYIKIQKESVFG